VSKHLFSALLASILMALFAFLINALMVKFLMPVYAFLSNARKVKFSTAASVYLIQISVLMVRKR